ncbi:ISL3 family transposase [Variovorax sp. SRS16]|uniref:ISL3 family transposase n=1 Tax=Variovorax sp. SRS16 TaxID=282217 RepID=UPI0013A55E88
MTSGIGVIDRVLARVGKRVVGCINRRGYLVVQTRSTVRAAPCPTCRCWSGRLHGSYCRQLAERPVLDEQVVLSVETRRFKCLNDDCPRRTFAEDIHALAGRHQRRTRSHARALHALGHALGGEAATRLAAELGLSASADTVLRELRRSAVTGRKHLPRIVGIDDWAIAKGHHYGTIVVDLERREPIEVFAGREATAVAAWMRANPSIRVVARDRAGAYSEAADIALPAATQVSDRWHLLSNLRDNVERMLHRLGPQLRHAAQQVTVGSVTLGRQGLPQGAALRGWQRLSDDRRATCLALYEKVMMLRTQGGSMKGIARELSIDYRTVRKFVTSSAFPERAPRARGPTPLDAHRRYIEERIAQGCHCPSLMWQEVRQRGYTGCRATVLGCVARLLSPQCKPASAIAPVRTLPCPSARRAFGWLVGWRKLAFNEPRHVDHERFVQALVKIEPVVAEVRSLAREFLGLMHRRRPREFDRWLERLSKCSAPEMQNFARSLRHDLAAVRAAFTLPWSNGQTEGHVNRLKFLKRQMYGRASVELLRLRVLGPS